MIAAAPAVVASHCPWCGNAFTAAGEVVDRKPDNLMSLPKVPCRLCARIESMFRSVPRQQMPMTRVEKFEAGVVEKGKPGSRNHKIISVQRRMEAVDLGRSCLPASDRD